MRTKLSGFVVSVLMVMAVGGLTAPPTFATDYFVKNLHQVTLNNPCPPPKPLTGSLMGSAVFKRTATTMSVTIYLRHAQSNTEYDFVLLALSPGGGCGGPDRNATTDGNGDATVRLGPAPLKGSSGFIAWITRFPNDCGCALSEVVPAR